MLEDVGVGDCPGRGEGLGHVWSSSKVDSRKPCSFCGRPGRDGKDEKGGFLAEATSGRAEFFSGLRVPMVSGSGDSKKAWPNGMPKDMVERAAKVREDIVREQRARKAGS